MQNLTIQLAWLPFTGAFIFGIATIVEYRSKLGIFSPSGLTSFYSLIKFCVESLVVLQPRELTALAALYGVTDTWFLSQSLITSFIVSSLTYLILVLLSQRTSRELKHISKSENRKEFYTNYRTQKSFVMRPISVNYIFIMFLGVSLIVMLIQLSGGLTYFLTHISKRYQMLAGLGFPLKISLIFIQLSTLYFFITWHKRAKLLSYFFLLFGMCVLLTMGGRTAPIFLYFCSLVYIHFYVEKLRLTIKTTLVLAILFCGAIFISIARSPALNEIIDQDLSAVKFRFYFTHVGAYFSYILRDAVIISYFAENEFWNGLGFSSFLYAFIPRLLFPEKPVIDNAIYVIAMTIGQDIRPPMTPDQLPHYGWPESYMSGYMEAGWLGLLVVIILSCMLINFVFLKLLRSRFSLGWLFLYCLVIFRQPLYLSSVDLFNFTFNAVVILIITWIANKRLILGRKQSN